MMNVSDEIYIKYLSAGIYFDVRVTASIQSFVHAYGNSNNLQ